MEKIHWLLSGLVALGFTAAVIGLVLGF